MDKSTPSKDRMSSPATGGVGQTADDMQSISPLPVHIHAQYIKDMSIENPNAPHSLKMTGGRPSLDVAFTMDAKSIKEEGMNNLFEVTLGIEATAKKDETVAFIVELQYAVLVSLNDVPDEQAHPLLLIEMPRYIFPFARQILADATQQAGFTPLLLSPVDFRDFYVQRYGQKQPPQAQAKTA